MAITRGDIDAIYNALRPRLAELLKGGTAAGSGGVTVPAHTHSADRIGFAPAGNLAEADDVQEAAEELDSEKLARDGSQKMLGALDMNHHSASNVDDLDVEGTATVAEDVTLTGAAGLANVNGLRRARLVVATQAGVDYSAAEGDVSWDAVEGLPVFYVASGVPM